jgi:HD-GYP domain-containing protein (c-di-GMP phosphodiesterase class II)
MSSLFPPGEIRFRAVALIEARRRDMVATVLRSSSVTPHTISMASGGFVGELLDRIRREFGEADGEIVERWIDNELTSGEHAGLIALTCSVLSATYAGVHGACEPLDSYLTKRAEKREASLKGASRERSRKAERPAMLEPSDEVVASLLSAIEARDPRMCEHARVTGVWSGRLAKALGMSAQEQKFAVLCGTVHDVGKIATPSEILLKSDPLTPDEWIDMKAHTLVGAKMLERIPSLRDLASSARWHHERIDGQGYPDGLAGEQIPFMVRVVAVADSFHAMITTRPYQPAMPVARALEILKEGGGTRWDAAVVDAMIHLVRPSSAGRLFQRRAEAGGF